MGLLGALLLAFQAPPAAMPFVGCPADGQTGPIAAPAARPMPDVPGSGAAALAWYVSEHEAVLAPRGWQCFELYGSNGGILVVAPQPLSFDQLVAGNGVLRGPAVIRDYTLGGTSGRFTVVDLIARYFPAHRAFIQEVRDMGFDLEDLPDGPYPNDRIVTRSATMIRLTTPPGRVGAATTFRLAPNELPAETVIRLYPGSEMDASVLIVRLPAGQKMLGSAIIDQMEREDRSRAN